MQFIGVLDSLQLVRQVNNVHHLVGSWGEARFRTVRPAAIVNGRANYFASVVGNESDLHLPLSHLLHYVAFFRLTFP